MLKLAMRLASTRLGGIVFTTVWPWVDRSLLHATRGRFSIAGLGVPTLLLTTTGRRSGKPREAPLLYLLDGERFVVVGSRGGRPDAPQWFRNLQANPEALVLAQGRRTPCTAYVAHGAERDALWRRLNEIYPGFNVYQARVARAIPVVVLVPQSDDSDVKRV